MDQYKNEKQPKSQQSETNNDQESNAVSDHANSAQSEQLHRPLQQPQKTQRKAPPSLNHFRKQISSSLYN
ncbi:hypothetical protein, partial [Lapidilactobacillus luobeiensis]|uniref:hypothetical protein n=1 Tax=Lapidilactobacillus luobeiensis TaxID=2950371 RepID=UPI0021C27B4C